MHDVNEAECAPTEEAQPEKRRRLPEGCGYRLGIFVFFWFVVWLATSLLSTLAS